MVGIEILFDTSDACFFGASCTLQTVSSLQDIRPRQKHTWKSHRTIWADQWGGEESIWSTVEKDLKNQCRNYNNLIQPPCLLVHSGWIWDSPISDLLPVDELYLTVDSEDLSELWAPNPVLSAKSGAFGFVSESFARGSRSTRAGPQWGNHWWNRNNMSWVAM